MGYKDMAMKLLCEQFNYEYYYTINDVCGAIGICRGDEFGIDECCLWRKVIYP